MKAYKLIVLIALIFALSGCGTQEKVKNRIVSKDTNKEAELITDNALLAKGDSYSLQYNMTEKSLIIFDNNTEQPVWSTAFNESEYPVEIKNNLIKKGLRQLINISYTDFGGTDGVINDKDNQCKTVERKIDNGIRLDFNFKNLSIKLSLEITLKDDALQAYIPMSSLEENGEYGITRIDILPMLGAVTSDENGYFLYPDGSGALYKFGTYMGSQKSISMDVYDNMITDVDNNEGQSKSEKVYLPVFGVKYDTKGLFAHIQQGAENCSINLASDETNYAVNRLYSSIRIRNQFAVKTASDDVVYSYQKDAMTSDYLIEYHFLKNNPSYSDMANIYRRELISQKKIKQNDKPFTAAIDFLVNVNKKQMIGNQSIIASDFNSIYKALEELGGKNQRIATLLYGWQSEGYNNYPTSSVLSRTAGDEKSLKKLGKLSDIFLLCNYTDAMSDNRGFSKQNDIIYGVGNTPVTDTNKTKYLLNPLTQRDRLLKDIHMAENVNASIAFEKLGSRLYEDFDTKKRLSRTGYINSIKNYLATAADNGLVATDGYMPFVGEYADYIFNLADDTSNLFVWDEEVPFIQMVIHGSIPYSAALPGNLSSDLQLTKLRWIEYGYIPSFVLTTNSESLAGTNYDKLFSSDYKGWRKTVKEILDEFNNKFSDLSDNYIVYHENENGIAKIKYCTGIEILINYNAEPVVVDGLTVNARDYIRKE